MHECLRGGRALESSDEDDDAVAEKDLHHVLWMLPIAPTRPHPTPLARSMCMGLFVYCPTY